MWEILVAKNHWDQSSTASLASWKPALAQYPDTVSRSVFTVMTWWPATVSARPNESFFSWKIKEDNYISCQLKIWIKLMTRWWPFSLFLSLRCGCSLVSAAVRMSLLLIISGFCVWICFKNTCEELKDRTMLWNVSRFLLAPAVWTVSFLASADERSALSWTQDLMCRGCGWKISNGIVSK